jgi:hypothetical protein
MKVSIVFLLLLLGLAVAADWTEGEYLLNPSIPPVAFLGQYYTCDFRVAGLSGTTYTFEKLPQFFRGSSSGRVEGTPDAKGSYEVVVNYRSNQVFGKKSVILRISEPDQS